MEKFLGTKLLFVVAHPDDESFVAAGTILKNRALEGKNYIICATMGEKGKSHLKQPMNEAELKKIRKRELERAAKFLKIDGLFFLNLPDTKVLESISALAKKTEQLIKKIKPNYIFSFGPDGISGHLDHVAAGKATQKLAEKLKIPFIAFGAPPSLRNQFKKIKARRRHGKYAKTIKHALPNLKIAIDAKQKFKTLNFHKSQFGESTLSASLPKVIKDGFMVYEYFVK